VTALTTACKPSGASVSKRSEDGAGRLLVLVGLTQAVREMTALL
jgi:hypothetical protein